ncbi:MAG: CinA family protein [Actinobacteria bacterium]|jgi:nicotinamide-nucleotide amidase|nr:CinA family protein [Actinomycetota bacterium]
MSQLVITKSIIRRLAKLNKTLAVAESITAGGIAEQLTRVPGSSKVFLGGVIAYSDQIKMSKLSIIKSDLQKHTAVSEQVAIDMAKNVRREFKSDYAISTTGVAGPKKAYGQRVGTVWVGISSEKESFAISLALSGDREVIRHATITSALAALERILKP